MLNKVDEWEREENTAITGERENLSSKIKASEERMEKLVSAYLDNDIPKQIYLKRKDEIMHSIASLTQQKKDFDAGKKKWNEPLRAWILDTKQADILANSDDLVQIKAFVQKVGTNPRISGKTPDFGFSPPSENTARLRAKMHSHLVGVSANSELNSEEISICGGGEIRTLGTFRFTRFPSVRTRPLCDASVLGTL